MPHELPWVSEKIVKSASLFCGNFRKSLRESAQNTSLHFRELPTWRPQSATSRTNSSFGQFGTMVAPDES